MLPREKLSALAVKNDFSISPQVLKDLCLWRAARYLRPAFPEAFEKAFREQSKKFKKIVEQNHQGIDRILIDYQPRDEITSDDHYEIKVVFLMRPENFKSPPLLDAIQKIADDSQKLLNGIQAFEKVVCNVESLAGFSLWDANGYLDWSRYDYLSFGDSD